jgi:hypothetical protein
MLNRKFKFYVPGTNGGTMLDRGLQERMADVVLDDFGTMFGGATVTEAKGVWKNPASGRLVREPVILVESFTDDEGAYQHEHDVLDLAADVAGQMGQETVAVEIDDVLHLVPARQVEVEAAAIAA